MAEDQIRKEIDALKNDIAQFRKDIGGLTDALKTVLGEKVDETKRNTKDKASKAMEDLESKIEALLAQGSGAVKSAGEKVSEHPGTSLLTAFGVGFIIAKLLGAGDRR